MVENISGLQMHFGNYFMTEINAKLKIKKNLKFRTNATI